MTSKAQGAQARRQRECRANGDALVERTRRNDESAYVQSSISAAETLLAETQAFAAVARRRTGIAPPAELLAGKNASFIVALTEEASRVQSTIRFRDRFARHHARGFERLRREKVALAEIHAGQEAEFIELSKKHDEARAIMGERSRLEARRVDLQARRLLQDERKLALQRSEASATRCSIASRSSGPREGGPRRCVRLITERLQGRVRARIDGRADQASIARCSSRSSKTGTCRDNVIGSMVDRN